MSLKDVRGQDWAIGILKAAVKQDRVAHAYLFLGPKGIGKAKTAIEFAKFLNCAQAKDDDCCDSCPSCAAIKNFTHPDIFFISKAKDKSRIPIDDIRQLQQRLSLKAFEAKWKAAIIADAEDMNEEAANCILKILEEPPPQTVFILTAANQKSLPQTIVSRCQLVKFRPLTRDEVNSILVKDFSMEEKEASFLSAVSGQNMAKAMGFKEKEVLRWKNDVIDEFMKDNRLSGQDTASALEGKRGIQIEAMDILLGFCRDVLIYKITTDPQLIINIDRADDIADMAGRMNTGRIQEYIKDIEKAKESLQANANPKLALRVLKESLC